MGQEAQFKIKDKNKTLEIKMIAAIHSRASREHEYVLLMNSTSSASSNPSDWADALPYTSTMTGFQRSFPHGFDWSFE